MCCCDGPSIEGHRLDSADEIGEETPECCGDEMDETTRDGSDITYTCASCDIVLMAADGHVDLVIYPTPTPA
ncbi:hypothetical protein [Streptomyces sp. SM12]|uniref:hypothetical protein n=1 Tax=Streptomyces sp. SM12 TaxID=1071602 RepID=UPI000CD5431D|nr:hypothetical protein [Streptomyces sp. SM12]